MPQLLPMPEGIPVLIAGGGPVGLTLAALLARHGVRSLVVEADAGYCSGSRAIGISRRSQEILWTAGAGAALAAKALPWTGGRSEVLQFRMASEPTQRFAPMVDIQQQDVEAFVHAALEGVPELAHVAWSRRVQAVHPRDDGVLVEIKGEAGRQRVRVDYVVACDGDHGTVRAPLGLQLEGTRDEDRFRHGRVLFAGDAAHLGPTFGVRGLNSGLEDAANLAWKLAQVLEGGAGAHLLDTYAQERLQAARSALNGPDEGTWRSALAAPGQPAPEALLDGAHGPLHLSQCFGTEFTCLVFGDGPLPRAVAELATQGIAVLDIAPEADTLRQARDRYGLPDDAGATGLVLVRPDGYVMGRWRGLNPAPVLACLRDKGVQP